MEIWEENTEQVQEGESDREEALVRERLDEKNKFVGQRKWK